MVYFHFSWWKRDPWLSSKSLDLDERLALLEQQKEKNKTARQKKGKERLEGSLLSYKTHCDRDGSLDISKIQDKSKTNDAGKRRRSSGFATSSTVMMGSSAAALEPLRELFAKPNTTTVLHARSLPDHCYSEQGKYIEKYNSLIETDLHKSQNSSRSRMSLTA